MALSIRGSRPSITRKWSPIGTMRGNTADVPGGAVNDRAVYTIGVTATADPPETEADIIEQNDSGRMASSRMGSWRYNGLDFEPITVTFRGDPLEPVAALTGTQHRWWVVLDADAEDPKPVLAYQDITPT